MMKKSLKFLLATATALAVIFSMTACSDDDKTKGGGLPATIEQANQKVQSMPVTQNEDAIENAIENVFGVDLELPEGSYSAQSVSYGGVSSYMVTVSGANTTAAEYYNGIKSQMLSKGYFADETEYGFYKLQGTVVYAVAVEGDGNDIIIYTGVSTSAPNGTTPSTGLPDVNIPGVNIPDVNIPGVNIPETPTTGASNSDSQIVSGGEVGLAPPSELVLPENVKIVTSVYARYSQLFIKIGNDFYYNDGSDGEEYYRYIGDEYTPWAYYEKVDGVWEYWGERDLEDILNSCLPYASTYLELMTEMNYDIKSTGNSQTIAGVNVKEYTYTNYGVTTHYWISDDGVCFNTDNSIVISSFDTSVTSFGDIELPDPNGKTSEFDFDDLPENVQITVQSGSGGYVDKKATMVKIGNDYAVTVYNAYTGEVSNVHFLKHKGPYSYSYYTWVSGEWFNGGTTDLPTNYGPLNDFEHMFNNDVSKYTQGDGMTYAGQSCTVYTKNGMYLSSIPSKDMIVMHEDGFVLRYQADLSYNAEWTNVSLIETLVWDESVTSFGDLVPPQ